jgi:hypothetical protein
VPGGSLLGGCDKIARQTPNPPPELRDPLLLLPNTLLQALDLLIHPQQHSDDRVAPPVIDRFGLSALHTHKIPCKPSKPSPQTEALNAFDLGMLCRQMS